MNWLAQQFELSRGGKAENLRCMEGLRGFAVFLVFLVHYVTFMTPWLPEQTVGFSIADALHTIGNAGVDLFFVLSGYLIYGSLIGRPQPFRRFMRRRIERIYPAFTAVFVLYIVLSFIFPKESKIPEAPWAAALYLLQNFLLLPGLFPMEPMITVAWSLSYEIFYYLTIPLVIAAFGLRERSRTWRVVFFTAVSIGTLALSAVYGGPVRLVMFIAGILLHEVISSKAVRAPASSVAVLALAGGLLGTLLPWHGSAAGALEVGFLYVSFFVLCFSAFSHPGSWLAAAFSWTPLRWLGNMSYSYYLLHGVSLKACSLALAFLVPVSAQTPIFFWGLLPVMFALTLFPTAALFLLVERPFSLAATLAGSEGRRDAQPQALPQQAQS